MRGVFHAAVVSRRKQDLSQEMRDGCARRHPLPPDLTFIGPRSSRQIDTLELTIRNSRCIIRASWNGSITIIFFTFGLSRAKAASPRLVRNFVSLSPLSAGS